MSKMRTAIPAILLGFFVMGFVDVVGISSSYVKADFDLPDALASMLPMQCSCGSLCSQYQREC